MSIDIEADLTKSADEMRDALSDLVAEGFPEELIAPLTRYVTASIVNAHLEYTKAAVKIIGDEGATLRSNKHKGGSSRLN